MLTVSAAQGFTELSPDASHLDLCSTWSCVVCGVKSGLIFPTFYVDICLSSGCHNKIPQTGVLNNRNSVVIVLEAGSLRSVYSRVGSW